MFLYSYIECGSILIYPEFSTLSEYQLFKEVDLYISLQVQNAYILGAPHIID